MRLRDMKKLFIALAAVTLTACVKAPEKTVKVYAWQGEGGNTTEPKPYRRTLVNGMPTE